MKALSLALVLIASLSVVGAAQTQDKGAVINGWETTTNSRGSAPTPAPQVIVGWNYYHAYACQTHFDGTFTWVYLFVVEGNLVFFSSNSASYQNPFQSACQSGNLVAIYVPNLSTWTDLITYSYK
jgi:hypothetical protein